jgi:hypothetical protein
VELDAAFRSVGRGTATDDDGYASNGTLPEVVIFDPDGIEVTAAPAERLDTGKYVFRYSIPEDAPVSSSWKSLWRIRIDGADHEFQELFRVLPGGQGSFVNFRGDPRKGHFFRNPDLTSDHYAPGWGLPVDPDEVRYIGGFGTRLVSPDDAQTYDDNMLQGYIDMAVAQVESELQYDLLPRWCRYSDRDPAHPRNPDPPPGNEHGQFPPQARLIREPGYTYHRYAEEHYLFMHLKRKPLIVYRDGRRNPTEVRIGPYQPAQFDLTSWARVIEPSVSQIKFLPPSGAGVYYLPFASTFPGVQGVLGFHHLFGGQDSVPDAILIDYDSGHEHSGLVPPDIRNLIFWLATIYMLEDFGDGKSPGLASASVGFGGLSQSFATTQSATNALYGARILSYYKKINNWMKMNARKYQFNLIGML